MKAVPAFRSAAGALGTVTAGLALAMGLIGCSQSSGDGQAESQGDDPAQAQQSTHAAADGVVEPSGSAQTESGGQGIVDPGDSTGKKKTNPKPKQVDAGAYADEGGSYYFQSASKKHFCRIADDGANCTSFAFPKAPKVEAPDGQGPKMKPDSISSSSTEKGSLWASSDPANALHGDVSSGHAVNKVLPYGSVLNAGGARCTVEQQAGVECKTGPHGFRLSSSGYKLW